MKRLLHSGKNLWVFGAVIIIVIGILTLALLKPPKQSGGRYVGLKDAKWLIPENMELNTITVQDIRRTEDLNRFEIIYIANVDSLSLLISMLNLGGLLERIPYPGNIVITANPCVVIIKNAHKADIKGDVYCLPADSSVFKELWPKTKEYGAYYEKSQPTVIYISDDAIESVVLYSDGRMKAYGALSNDGWIYGGEKG